MIIKMNFTSKLFVMWAIGMFTGWFSAPYFDDHFAYWWSEVLLCFALSFLGAFTIILIKAIPDIKDG